MPELWAPGARVVVVWTPVCTYVRFGVFVYLCVVVKPRSRLTGVGVVQGVGM